MTRWLALAILVLRCPWPLHADGGTIRFSERKENYLVTVFTSPTPERAGPVDLSVLLQRASGTTESLPAEIQVTAHRSGHPGAVRAPATTVAATNKLFQAALLDLPEAGEWLIDLAIDGPLGKVTAGFPLTISPPLPRWRTVWPWFCWPIVPIVFFLRAHRRPC